MEVRPYIGASIWRLSLFLFSHMLNCFSQDTIYFHNKTFEVVNLRKTNIREGVFKVTKKIDENEQVYNYTLFDIDFIATKDTSLARGYLKKDFEIGSLFAQKLNTGVYMFFYEMDFQRSKKIPARKVIKKDLTVFTDTIYTKGDKLNFIWGLKLSNTFSFFSNYKLANTFSSASKTTYTSEEKSMIINFWSPSFGISKSDKFKNLHDFSISFINYRFKDTKATQKSEESAPSTINGARTNVFNFGIGYRFSYFFLKNTTFKFLPSLSFFSGVNYSYNFYSPKIPTGIEQSIHRFSASFGIEPGINYFVKQHILVFLSIPIPLFVPYIETQIISNPEISGSKITSTNLDYLNPFKNWVWYLNLGLIVKIK
jgi:hypothetical protein